jgi:hypothetical protein
MQLTSSKSTIASPFVVLLVLALGAISSARAAAQPSPASVACDQECLSKIMTDFLSAMTTGKPGTVPLTDQAEVRENTKIITLDASTWRQVKAVRSTLIFSDPVTGNVVSRAGIELADGKPGYISTRLKVVPGGRITDVEIAADTSARVVASYVWNLGPQLTAVLPADQRISRVALEALGRRYFHGLSTHQPVAADFDDARCNRFHSGQQVTNAGQNTVEGGPARSCVSSNEGDRPWGPANEQRLSVIDPERGLVFGITLLHYLKSPDQRVMYVSEVFKVVGGKIVKIDNIGLMMPGVTTLGFIH